MKQALFIAEATEDKKAWDSFAAFAKQHLELTHTCHVLNEGAYLFDLSNGLRTISLIVGLARERHIPSRTLFFDQDPAWVYDKA